MYNFLQRFIMTQLAIQYLGGTLPPSRTIQQVQTRLQAAFDRLPLEMVLLGWEAHDDFVRVCAEVCKQNGAKLYRWQPLLTEDGAINLKAAWQTIGLTEKPIVGFQEEADFTFVCPNHPEARATILDHLRDLLQNPCYQGVFLDRMRWHSPASDPKNELGCFCEHCQRAAAHDEIDLEALRQQILHLLTSREGVEQFVHGLLSPEPPTSQPLHTFLDFRAHTINDFIQEAAQITWSMDKGVGLDCFSPALTRLVGQDLTTLNHAGDWIKIMSYGHTLGPAGIPFELLGLADWLIEQHDLEDAEALALLSRATQLPLPTSRAALRKKGLSPAALALETQRAQAAGVDTLLAGIELVEVPGISELNDAQITADLKAFQQAGADGLALSWDLWDISLDRLDKVRTIWA
jgi:hypothetical protein